MAPEFFGDPPIRLNDVITKAHLYQLANICGDDLTKQPDYTAAMQAVAKQIISQLKPGCIPAEIQNPSDPDCTVEDVTMKAGQPTMEMAIPRCDRVNNALPCWKVQPSPACNGISPQGLGVVIERATPPPEGTNARVECATIAR